MHSLPSLPNIKVDALDLRVIDESMSTLLQRTLASFRENKVSHSKWTLLSSRHQVQVYRKSKESKLHNLPQESDSVTSTTFVDSIQTFNECALKKEVSPSIRVHLNEPQIMANGFMEGSVDDFLYGIYSSDDVEWSQNNMHVCNRMFRSFTIANLRKPDEVDPFRTLTLRWGMMENPLMSSVLVRRKDIFFVQATGAKKDADGDRYGYFIMQSITHPNIPQTNAFASKLSICFIVRSRPSNTSTNSIDFHALVAFGSKGILSSAVAGRMLAKVIMGMADISNRAFLKKLSNAIGRNPLLQPSKKEMSSLLSPINCPCRRGSLLFRARWNNSRNCRRCDRVVCAKCSVNFHIPEKFLLGSQMKTEVKLVCFCLQCVVQIHQVSSWEIAQERVKLPRCSQHNFPMLCKQL